MVLFLFVFLITNKYLCKQFENLDMNPSRHRDTGGKNSLKVKYPFNSSLVRRAATMDYHGGNAFLTLLPHSCDSPLMWLLGKPAFIFGVGLACGGLSTADS